MKILVTGIKGQLGHDVVNELTGRGIEAAPGHKFPQASSPFPARPRYPSPFSRA